MQISKKYKIESDTLNVTLYRLEPKNRWRVTAFFASPQSALKYLVKHEIMGAGMANLETVCEKIEELEGLINKLRGLPEVLG